MKKETKVVQ